MIKYGLLLAILAVGCAETKTPTELEQGMIPQRLAENRATWAKNGSPNYQFNFQRSCFCIPDYTREVGIIVVNGAIVAAHYTDNGLSVEDDFFGSYNTIDELFVLLEEAVNTGAAQIDVEFDAVLGYPTNLFIDQDRHIADEEQWIAASKVVLNQ